MTSRTKVTKTTKFEHSKIHHKNQWSTFLFTSCLKCIGLTIFWLVPLSYSLTCSTDLRLSETLDSFGFVVTKSKLRWNWIVRKLFAFCFRSSSAYKNNQFMLMQIAEDFKLCLFGSRFSFEQSPPAAPPQFDKQFQFIFADLLFTSRPSTIQSVGTQN